MAKRPPLLRNQLDFEETVRLFLQTPPPPAGTPGSRKVKKPKNRKVAKKR